MDMVLCFHDVHFDTVDHNGQTWVRSPQIGEALGYEKGSISIAKLYEAHADEFTASMTALVTVPTKGGEQETRIFSLRGCHLLAMFARTPIAKEFRKWVLDVLDRLASEEHPQPAPESADAPLTPDQQCTLQGIVKAKVDAIPEAERNTRGLYPQVWQRFNNHFRLAKYAQLPQSRMSEAVEYLVKMELKPVKPIEPKKELPPAREKLPAKDKYESYMEEVEAFRARSAAEIEILLSKGLDLVNVYKFGPGGIKGFTTILLDWLQSVAGQHAPLIRYREPIDRAIVYSPLFLMKHMEAVLPDLRK